MPDAPLTTRIKHYLRYDWPLHFWLLATNWLPDNVKVLHWRGAVASRFLGSCGKGLELGRNVTFHNPANVHLGKDVFIAYGCMLMATDRIEIEDEVMFGPYCVLISGNHTRLNGSYRYGAPELAPICIGRGAWLGAHVVVTAGAEVGAGSLIAAGAVVTGAVPVDVVAGGVPARALKPAADQESG